MEWGMVGWTRMDGTKGMYDTSTRIENDKTKKPDIHRRQNRRKTVR
jgi:hypothetical protein